MQRKRTGLGADANAIRISSTSKASQVAASRNGLALQVDGHPLDAYDWFGILPHG